MGNIPSDEELIAQIEATNARGARNEEPRAIAARYNRETGRVEVELTNGCLFAFPAQSAQGLEGASADALAEVALSPEGKGLHWESLDADLSVERLVRGVFGSRRWMAEHARALGSMTTKAKAAAARANGRKGGRPRKAI